MVHFNPNTVGPKGPVPVPSTEQTAPTNGFSNTLSEVDKGIGKVNELQQNADASIVDLLAGKSSDITSVVSDVAKADMSFKLLVGVRNKLIEAYKQTMNMQV